MHLNYEISLHALEIKKMLKLGFEPVTLNVKNACLSNKEDAYVIDLIIFSIFDRLIDEGKLMDALALSDRCLRNGASDQLLQLLIERGEENNPVSVQPHGFAGHRIWSNSWQYCLRLKDKQLAAKLALKYVSIMCLL